MPSTLQVLIYFKHAINPTRVSLLSAIVLHMLDVFKSSDLRGRGRVLAQDAGVSHQLTFASRVWRDSGNTTTAGELLAIFEPRASVGAAGAVHPLVVMHISLRPRHHTSKFRTRASRLHLCARRASDALPQGGCLACSQDQRQPSR